jgi:hypothetical protein
MLTSAGCVPVYWYQQFVMLFRTGEAYSKTDLTKVKYNDNKLSRVEKE